MEFKAQRADLELELTTLNDEKITLTPTVLMTAEAVVTVLTAWQVEEDKSKTNVSKIELVAKELSLVYPKDKVWFLTNFDFGTLNEILSFVASAMGGIRKNVKSSN